MSGHSTKLWTSPGKSDGQRPVRVLVVDDHPIVREGLLRALAREPDMEVVGEAGDGRTAMQLMDQSQPNLVLMDIGLPDGDGMDFTRQILARWPAMRIIILSSILDREHMEEAIHAGVLGYILKVNAASELIKAIRAAMKNETYLCPEVSALLVGGYKELLSDAQKEGSSLSDREAEVLKLIAGGRNTKEIAAELGLSVKTVESHRGRLMAKLNIHSVADLTKYAIREGMIPL